MEIDWSMLPILNGRKYEKYELIAVLLTSYRGIVYLNF